MSEVGKLWVSVTAKTDEFQRGMNGVEKSLSATQKKLESASKKFANFGKIMTIGVTVPIVAAFKGMLDAAMHLEATEAKFNTVFQGMTDEASAFIKEFKKLTPLTTAEARGVASGIQDLLVPMGFLREDATRLTGKFMPLIGALANFNNATHTAAEVAQAVSSALVGEYEPMRRLGVVTNKTAIDQRVLAMGLAATKDEITDQMRAIALHEIITESSADAIAAYTEANLDSKTKMDLLRVEIIDTAAALGESLLPMINHAVEWVQKLTDKFSDLTEEQQITILKVGAFVAAIGPTSLLMSAVLGLIGKLLALKVAFGGIATATSVTAVANLTGYSSGLAAVGGAAAKAGGASGLGLFILKLGAVVGAGLVMLGTLALIVAAIGLVILAIKNWKQAWDRIPGEMKNWSPASASSGKGGSFTGGGSTSRGGLPVHGTERVSNQWFYSGSSKTSSSSMGGYKGMTSRGVKGYDTGGIVPGPRGMAQLAIVHGGETILPTHKGGGGASMDNTIRHEIDLINVPATVDKQSLEAGLTEMLNSPQVKRRIDRINYENTVAARGLGI